MPTIPKISSCKLDHVQSLHPVRQSRCPPARHCVQASRESSIQRSVESSQASRFWCLFTQPPAPCCQTRPRALAQAQASSRLPRFYCETPLPGVIGSSLQLSATESKHATRVLRLTDNTLVEVCDGQGQIVIGKLVTTAKAAAHIVTTTPSQQVLVTLLLQIHPSWLRCAANFASCQVFWQGCKWELAVACGSLQSSRADWLVEKCTELGAWSFRPILTDRSPGIGIYAIPCIRPSTPDAFQDTLPDVWTACQTWPVRMLRFSSVIVCMQAGHCAHVMMGMVLQPQAAHMLIWCIAAVQPCISMYLQASLVQVGREWARQTKGLAKLMVISRNKVLVALADGDALRMQPPNNHCGAFIIAAGSLVQNTFILSE